MTQNNPLLGDWTTPFEVPPFLQVEADHFREAFDAAFQEADAEIEAIAKGEDTPSFANTIEAMESAGGLLFKIHATFSNLASAHTNERLQAIERDIAPRLAEFHTKIMLNSFLFARIDHLYQTCETLSLNAEQQRLLEYIHARFVRAGAKLEGRDRARMAQITQRLAILGTTFSQNLLAEESLYELVLDGQDDLAGLPDFLVSAASEAASARGHAGKYVITLSRSLIEPFLQFSSRRDLREKAFKAWASRGENGNQYDNREIIKETLQLREELAKLLGFETFAAFKLDDQMAKAPDNVRDLLMRVWQPARARALEEAATVEALARSEGASHDIKPWDWRYYSERVRMREYDLKEAEIKPYLQLENIIKAAFHTAKRLFGLSFKERHDVPVYHQDVRVFEVMGRNGEHQALFLADYFARPSKRSGAWMSGFRRQERLKGNIRPIVTNVMNFAKAPKGEKTLLTLDDARTLFHEFGHALHGMLSNITYATLSGTNVARDFVELPSQLYEHWLLETDTLAKYAVHYKSGEPMPSELIARIKKAETFNQGFMTVEYIASALVDLELHTMPAHKVWDVSQIETEILNKIGMLDQIIMRHRTPHFAHVFSGDGYSAGYYAYMWSEVMDADAFRAFQETGNVFDEKLAKRLLSSIYATGGSRAPEELYLEFRGKMPDMSALLEGRGLKDAA